MDPDWRYRWKDTLANIDPTKIQRLEIDFLTNFLEQALISQPGNTDVLIELGEIYTQRGRVEEGLDVDRKLAKLLPDDPTVHYNLACSLALSGEKEKAMKALDAALRRGFNNFQLMMEDDDLATLREEPEFQALLDLARKALS